MVAALRSGAEIAVVADVFGGNDEVAATYCGKETTASAFPARLAAVAGVPLVPVVLRWSRDHVEAACGPLRHVQSDPESWALATREVLSFFESATVADPGICKYSLKGRCRAGA